MSNQNLNRELLVDINNNHIINHFDDYNLEFTVYTKEEAEQIADCGIYIFLNSENLEKCIYVGQTESFSDRLPDHERWQEAQVKGANCIGIAIVKKENLDSVEKMMIKKYKPILNEQYK